MGALLQNADEYTHTIGPASNWNESRYMAFFQRLSPRNDRRQ